MFIPLKKKTDCYYYHEEQDMGAHIPTCNRYCRLGYCPCESCDKYLSKKVLDKVVDKWNEAQRQL